jgi:hypothetical protein
VVDISIFVLDMLIPEFEFKYNLDVKYCEAVHVFTVDNRAVKFPKHDFLQYLDRT